MLPSFATVCVCNPNAGLKLPHLSELPFTIKLLSTEFMIYGASTVLYWKQKHELKYNVFQLFKLLMDSRSQLFSGYSYYSLLTYHVSIVNGDIHSRK